MRVPKSIVIGSYEIKVKIVHDPMDGARGLWEGNDLIIYIRKGLNPQQEWSVFLHECVEAINDLYDMELKEWQICCFEQELTKIFKQLKNQ